MSSTNTFNSIVKVDPAVEGTAKDPEQNLFIAILGQAVHDAFSGRVFRIERDEARSFLTRDNIDFRIICEMAGREPQYVLEKIRKRAKKNWAFTEARDYVRKPPTRSLGRKRGRPTGRGRRMQR